MSKRLAGIIGCKDRTFSWHLNGFPDGNEIGSTVECRGEAHCLLYCALSSIDMQGHQTNIKNRNNVVHHQKILLHRL